MTDLLNGLSILIGLVIGGFIYFIIADHFNDKK